MLLSRRVLVAAFALVLPCSGFAGRMLSAAGGSQGVTIDRAAHDDPLDLGRDLPVERFPAAGVQCIDEVGHGDGLDADSALCRPFARRILEASENARA